MYYYPCEVYSSYCIYHRVTCESIEKFLRGKGRKMWAERASKLAVVLVDSGTSGADLTGSDNTGLPLVQLRDIIHKVRVYYRLNYSTLELGVV